MKNLFGWMLVVLLVLTAGVSCSDDEELLAGNGIADAAWVPKTRSRSKAGCLITRLPPQAIDCPEFG